MRKTFTSLILAILFFAGTMGISSEAKAWWSVNANVDVNRTVVHARVYNRWDRPIYCSGYAYGRTYRGLTLKSHGSGVIYPGRQGGVYVYTNQNDPFVRGWADIRCRWH